jgi:hypothetical protein
MTYKKALLQISQTLIGIVALALIAFVIGFIAKSCINFFMLGWNVW